MKDSISDEKLWSWVDREAPELESYLKLHPDERERVDALRCSIGEIAQEIALPIPERVGQYAVTGLLGEGGMGLVLEAEQESPHRSVAVKILRGHLASDPAAITRFKKEAHVLGRLSHPGIAKIFEAGRTEDGQHFLVMELVRGKPLHEYVRDNDLSRFERLKLFVEISETVHAAHEEGVVHRDLKPTNVLLDARGRPRVLDFGLARIADDDLLRSTVSEAKKLMGTPQFMSPEQILGDSEKIDRRTDVYALGVILFTLLTNEPPYRVKSRSLPEVARVICEEPPRRPDAIDSSLRGDLTTIVLKALEKDPPRRYPTARALAEDVRRVMERRPILARPPSLSYLLQRFVSRHRVATIVGVGAVALYVASVFLLLGARQAQEAAPESRRHLSVASVGADLDAFERNLEDRFAYLKANGVDFGSAIEAIRKKASSLVSVEDFALELQKVVALSIDGHAQVLGLQLPGGHLPFLIEPMGDRFIAIREDRSGFVDADHPYLERIDGVDLAGWLTAISEIVPKGSPQYQTRHGLRYLRYLQFWRKRLGLPRRSTLEVGLVSRDGERVRSMTIKVSHSLPIYGRWPRVHRRKAILDGNIGYLRIASMDAVAVGLVRAAMQELRETRGLIVDVRSNGGGTREALLGLFPYFLSEEDSPRVANVAAYRLFAGFPEDHLADRFAYRASSGHWSDAERAAIGEFRKTFVPGWTLPKGEFSEWHYMVISKGVDDDVYHYERPVVILQDSKCSSATDVFLGAFKGWRNVTLVGTASAGQSARLMSFSLESSGLGVVVASMASFQPNGSLYDTNGVEPDVFVDPPPEYFLEGGPDVFIGKALEILGSRTGGGATLKQSRQ